MKMNYLIALLMGALMLLEAHADDRRRGSRGSGNGNNGNVSRTSGGGNTVTRDSRRAAAHDRNRGSRGSGNVDRNRGSRGSGNVDRNRGSRGSGNVDRNRGTGRTVTRDSRRDAARDRNRGTVTRDGRRNDTGRTVRTDRDRRHDRVTRTSPHVIDRRIRTEARQRNRIQRRGYYGSRNYHRPHNYVYRPYRSYSHRSVTRNYVHRTRYSRNSYYRHLRVNLARGIYFNWILPHTTRLNGYYNVNQYPYFIHNGYRHRYSRQDTCNYQLVDKHNHQVVLSYWNRTCSFGYDQCAYERDRRNQSNWENRYFCAETFRDRGYNFSRPTYEYDQYEDSYSNNNDYSYNNDSSNECYDYDYDTGICYDEY